MLMRDGLYKQKQFILQTLQYRDTTGLVAWRSELLTTSHEVPGSIPSSAMGIFFAGEDPHSDNCLGSP
jgi:hypothetical protein